MRLVESMVWVALGCVTTFACADEDHYGYASGGSTSTSGGSNSTSGSESTGGVVTARGGSGGAASGGREQAGAENAGAGGQAGSSNPGSGGVFVGTGGAGGSTSTTGGVGNAGESGAGGTTQGDAGAGGAGGAAEDPVLARGRYLVVAVAQCGGCHTDSSKPNDVLGGNPNFKSGGVVIAAHNLTPDSTGLGDWTDTEIKRAIRQGLDNQDRQLAPAMPYWLFHNLSDADTDAIVRYLRSIKPVVNVVGDSNAGATPVAFLSPAAFPNTSLSAGPEFEAAREGKYLLTSAARCVACHSTSTGGVPAPGFSGRAPSASGAVYPPNLTPDATGILGWSATDVANVLLTSLAKGTTTPICSMPRYAALTSDDALAIGQYLTSIPAVENAAANLSNLPACP